MTAQEMLDLAIEELRNLKSETCFTVKDLFKGYTWNNQKKSERLLLGTLFLNYARQNPSSIKILDKTSSGQQEYELGNFIYRSPGSRADCFLETKIMSLEIIDDGIFVVIGTSGNDRLEMFLRNDSDAEKICNILKRTLSELQNPFDCNGLTSSQ